MTPKALRQQLRQRRKDLRRLLPGMRRDARARVEQLPAVRREKRRRRIRRTVVAAIVVLLACLIRCDCGRGPPVELAKVELPLPVVVKPKVKVLGPGKLKPLHAQVDPQPRLGYLGGARPPPRWIDEFRLQVSARSPRLSECFNGTERPGALRWTASVNPESGAVTEHELEPLGSTSEFAAWLARDQRECLVRVLSNPPYKLTVPKEEALPDRVSLVLEF